MSAFSFSVFVSAGVFVVFGLLSLTATAESGHCDYELYSKVLDRRIKVCQSVESIADCGKLMDQAYDKSMARAVGNKESGAALVKGECSPEAVVGICMLPHSKIYFYEGDAGDLAAGCDRIKGQWNAKRR